MSYEPLHQKYRPQCFADLVGQSAIADTLSNAIDSQRIAPAYLFSGPRGTGKTSSARILAKSLNCVSTDRPTPHPCGKCDICRAIKNNTALDIIEIDAASNTGVDNIREIIDRSSFAPVQCRYKLYVIDEAHMLSTAAFNALLKTLEEPPPRVVFVLATTDPQRVLPTIISRCQRFDFQRIPLMAMVSHLKNIAQQETIDITEEAITVIAQVSHGGLRDAQSLLDQLSLLSGTITIDRVWDLVGAIPEKDLIRLIQAIKKQNGKEIITLCRQLMDRGREPLIVLQALAGFYRDLLIAKTAPTQSELVALTASTWKELCKIAQEWDVSEILNGQRHLQHSEVQIKNTTQPRLWLEVTLLGLLNVNQPVVSQVKVTPVVASASEESKSEAIKKSTPIEQPISPPKEETKPTVSNVSTASEKEETSSPPSPSDSVATEGNESEIWSQVLKRLSIPSQSLFREHCQLLKVEGNLAQIGIKNQKLLALAKNEKRKKDVEQALTEILHRNIAINLQVTGEYTHQTPVRETFKEKPVPPSSPPRKEKTPPPEEHQETEQKQVDSTVDEEKQEPEKPPPPSTPETEPTVIASGKSLEKIAQEFAKAFNGEVITFEKEEPPLPMTNDE